MSEDEKARHIRELASSFQEAVIDSLMFKLSESLKQTEIKTVLIAGGVAASSRLRYRVRAIAHSHDATVLFPAYKYLNGDNAAMIGVAAYFKRERAIESSALLDRFPRLQLA